MIEEYNIVITGVGGQGVLTAANILGWTALKKGLKVRVGEVHGLSQRFGTVISYVRIGENVYGAMVSEGKADIILSFEPVEALRYIYYIKKNGIVISNSQPIPPVQVSIGLANYPSIEKIREIIEKEFEARLVLLNAEKLALEAGDIITLNTVLLGALSQAPGFPLEADDIKETIEKTISKKFLETNIKAFELGKKEMARLLK